MKNKSDNVPEVDCSTVTQTASAEEVTTLKHYIDSSAVSAVQDSRGFFYSMDSTVADSASHATVCSNVAVTYKGTLLNGTVIDSSNTVLTFQLSNVITGWKEMLPLMIKKASVTLYLPPSLAYGTIGYLPAIPGNAYLVFTIKMYDFD